MARPYLAHWVHDPQRHFVCLDNLPPTSEVSYLKSTQRGLEIPSDKYLLLSYLVGKPQQILGSGQLSQSAVAHDRLHLLAL